MGAPSPLDGEGMFRGVKESLPSRFCTGDCFVATLLAMTKGADFVSLAMTKEEDPSQRQKGGINPRLHF